MYQFKKYRTGSKNNEPVQEQNCTKGQIELQHINKDSEYLRMYTEVIRITQYECKDRQNTLGCIQGKQNKISQDVCKGKQNTTGYVNIYS